MIRSKTQLSMINSKKIIQVRNRFHTANKAVQTRIEATTTTVNKGREWVRSSVFTPAHSVMDFLENKLEFVMLKSSSGKRSSL